MDLTHGTSAGSGLISLNGDWVLALDTATGRYARRFELALPTGGFAEGVRWQAGTSLTVSFPTFEYDARTPGAPEAVSVSNDGSEGVTVTFPVPRTLRRVKISGAQSGDLIEARRVDGNVVTDDAFAQASHGTAGATLNAVDLQLVLRQKRAGGPVALRAAHVDQILVRSEAANVRVGVALPALGDDVFFLGPDAGEVLTTPATASNLGPALAPLLQGACDRLTGSLDGGLLPSTLPVILIIESDTPAKARIAGFVLRYRLYRRRFDDLATKRVLDFPGQALTTRPFAIHVPRTAALWSATLRMMGPLREQDGENDEEAGHDGPPPTSPGEASDLGVHVMATESVAAPLTLPQAALIQGATLEVVALADATTGRVRLHADTDGRPGDTLAEGILAAGRAGGRVVVRAEFDRPLVVSAGSVWAALHCDSGALLWMTTAADGSARVPLLRRPAGSTAWTPVGPVSDRRPRLSFVTASGSGGSADGSGPASFHGVRLFLGGTRVRGTVPTPGSPGDKETRFDVAASIAPMVEAGSIGTLVSVPLSLVSSERGRVTVYPPELEFDP